MLAYISCRLPTPPPFSHQGDGVRNLFGDGGTSRNIEYWCFNPTNPLPEHHIYDLAGLLWNHDWNYKFSITKVHDWPGPQKYSCFHCTSFTIKRQKIGSIHYSELANYVSPPSHNRLSVEWAWYQIYCFTRFPGNLKRGDKISDLWISLI